MAKIITTTTNNIEGWNISEYFQPISSNVVVGANLFSDISASWTDMFGGRSSSYEKKLQQIYKQAITNLTEKAARMGANCIVGLKIDIDEISGKGSQMFMITAFGTPVKAQKGNENKTNIGSDKFADGQYIESKVRAKRIIESFKKFKTLKIETIHFIIESGFNEFADVVLEYIYILSGMQADAREELNELSKYFAVIPINDSTDTLYKELEKGASGAYKNHILSIINEYGLINYERVIKLLESDNIDAKKAGLYITYCEKPSYSDIDKKLLNQIKELLNKVFLPVGEVTTKKKLLSSSEKEIWICSCGKTNEMDSEFCINCENDIYGFKSNQVKPKDVIDLITDRLIFIDELV